MFKKSPTYANVITFALPAVFLLFSIVVGSAAAASNAGAWSLALLAPLVIAGFVNALLSQLAAVMAEEKGRSFPLFYFLGLFFGFLILLIVAAAMQPLDKK